MSFTPALINQTDCASCEINNADRSSLTWGAILSVIPGVFLLLMIIVIV